MQCSDTLYPEKNEAKMGKKLKLVDFIGSTLAGLYSGMIVFSVLSQTLFVLQL